MDNETVAIAKTANKATASGESSYCTVSSKTVKKTGPLSIKKRACIELTYCLRFESTKR